MAPASGHGLYVSMSSLFVDRTSETYFLKSSAGDLGKSMLRGEFEGAKVIHNYNYTPEGIPRPVAWGTYRSDPDTHLYPCEFMNMTEKLIDIRKFSAMLAKLHRDSMDDPKAPDKFGFHVMTHEGRMYQDVSWADTWEEMYTRRFQSFVRQELVSQGPSKDLDEILPHFIHGQGDSSSSSPAWNPRPNTQARCAARRCLVWESGY